jgi:hypothetical protein
MDEQQDAQAMQLPAPDPELKRLDRFVGTWELRGRTQGSQEDDVSGRIAFEWLPGGYFLQQRIEIHFAGFDVGGLELIGYDPERGVYPSTVFSNLIGTPLAYEYRLDGDDVTIHTEVGGGATYRGTFSPDGSAMSGGWRPDEGKEGPGNIAYDITGTRTS